MDAILDHSAPPTDPPRRASSTVLLIVVWLVVGLPALWGVSRTVQTSMKLFKPPAATATTQPATVPTTASTTKTSLRP